MFGVYCYSLFILFSRICGYLFLLMGPGWYFFLLSLTNQLMSWVFVPATPNKSVDVVGICPCYPWHISWVFVPEIPDKISWCKYLYYTLSDKSVDVVGFCFCYPGQIRWCEYVFLLSPTNQLMLWVCLLSPINLLILWVVICILFDSWNQLMLWVFCSLGFSDQSGDVCRYSLALCLTTAISEIM